jgi:hypothetical protein
MRACVRVRAGEGWRNAAVVVVVVVVVGEGDGEGAGRLLPLPQRAAHGE